MIRSLLLSLEVSVLATLLAVAAGTALGLFLARSRRRWKWVVEMAACLPLVFPPTLTGYYLILLVGRRGLIGGPLFDLTGFAVTFHVAGAVLAGAVVSFPLMTLSARAALEGVDPDLERAGYTLGRGRLFVFLRVTLPLAWRGLAAGAILAFARALGEFGATLMVAGNVETMPLAIWKRWMAEGMEGALPFVLIHTAAAAAVLGTVFLVRRKYGGSLV